MNSVPIVFVGNGRCFHTMDWFRSAQSVCKPRPVFFVTDLLESEGHARLLRPTDPVINLINIDRFLLPRQSSFGHWWRNALKFALLPLQAVALRGIYRRMPSASYHAHTMYYMLLCSVARVPFVGTPQGSELLVRPKRSFVYRWFAARALRAASVVTVDSLAMSEQVLALSGRSAVVIQNGIPVSALLKVRTVQQRRDGVLSIRGITANYRITQLLDVRQRSRSQPSIALAYPFADQEVLAEVRTYLRDGDRDLGRLAREQLYAEMAAALLVVSIPISDSSPRSVYEAIFAGACVAVTPNPFVDFLPSDMRARVIMVDLSAPHWLDDALARARAIVAAEFVPSAESIDLFDQLRAMGRVCALYASRGRS